MHIHVHNILYVHTYLMYCIINYIYTCTHTQYIQYHTFCTSGTVYTVRTHASICPKLTFHWLCDNPCDPSHHALQIDHRKMYCRSGSLPLVTCRDTCAAQNMVNKPTIVKRAFDSKSNTYIALSHIDCIKITYITWPCPL